MGQYYTYFIYHGNDTSNTYYQMQDGNGNVVASDALSGWSNLSYAAAGLEAYDSTTQFSPGYIEASWVAYWPGGSQIYAAGEQGGNMYDNPFIISQGPDDSFGIGYCSTTPCPPPPIGNY